MSRKKATGGKDPGLEPMVIAIADLVGRTGAQGFQLRYSDDEQPVVWLAVATYEGGLSEVGASTHPGEAAWRLGEQLIDGGTCAHCGKLTALLRPEEDGLLERVQHASGLAGCQWTLRGDRVVRGCER